ATIAAARSSAVATWTPWTPTTLPSMTAPIRVPLPPMSTTTPFLIASPLAPRVPLWPSQRSGGAPGVPGCRVEPSGGVSCASDSGASDEVEREPVAVAEDHLGVRSRPLRHDLGPVLDGMIDADRVHELVQRQGAGPLV